MERQSPWRQLLVGGFCALSLTAFSGCLSYLHPVSPPQPELTTCCHEVPQCARDHVYVFLVHGLDPCNFANLTGVRDYIQGLGFHKTYFGQLYHYRWLERELRRIHHEDPDARFVLIGFSYGASMVRSLAEWVKDEGIKIDLLVYLGGNTLDNVPYDHPDNVAVLVNILATGCVWNGTTFDNAENIHLPDVWHFGTPTHKRTLEVLARGLAVVASHVPVPPPAEEPSLPPAEDNGPTPRPVMPRSSAKHDEWDFLKPVSKLEHEPPASSSSKDAAASLAGN